MRQKLMEFLRKRGPLVLFGLGAVVVLFFVSRNKGATETVARAVTGTLTGQNVQGLSYIQFGTQPKQSGGGPTPEPYSKVKTAIGVRPTEGIPGGEVPTPVGPGDVPSENLGPTPIVNFRPPAPTPQSTFVSANPSAMRYTRGWEFKQA